MAKALGIGGIISKVKNLASWLPGIKSGLDLTWNQKIHLHLSMNQCGEVLLQSGHLLRVQLSILTL